MSSGIGLSLILLVVLSASLYFLIQAEGGFGEVPRLLERVGIMIGLIEEPPGSGPVVGGSHDGVMPVPGPAEFTSGQSRFSQGKCQQDSDCVTAGCSGEVCGVDPGIVTTCEFSESFPNAQGYSCGCVQGVCGWSR